MRTLVVDRSVVRIPSTSIEQEEGKFKDEIVPVETIQVIEKDGKAWLVCWDVGAGQPLVRVDCGGPGGSSRPTGSILPCKRVHGSGAFGRCRLLAPACRREGDQARGD